MSRWTEYNRKFNERVDWRKVGEEIIGLELIGNPSGDGWVSCRSVDGEDANPSASYNVKSGYYKDFRDGRPAISAYDLMYECGEAESFQDARAKIAKKYGITVPVPVKGDPEFGVKWQPWNDALAEQYCANKPPITIAGLKRAGAKMCLWNKVPSFALPVVDTGGKIVGWMFLRRNGEGYDLGKGKGAKAICKVSTKEGGAFVCHPEVMDKAREACRFDGYTKVFWCEGAPDMLAGLSKFTGSDFITNCHGTQENIKFPFNRTDVVIIADCDKPGVNGALKRAGKKDTIKRPPGDVSDKHGKDYRDHLLENPDMKNVLSGLVDVTGDRETAIKEEQEQRTKGLEQAEKRQMKSAKGFLNRVGCHILSSDFGNEVVIYSDMTHGLKTLDQGISRVGYEDIVQFLGGRFRSQVLKTSKEVEAMVAVGDGGYSTFSDFKAALALASTDVTYKDIESVGVGVWPVEDEDREKTGETLIVKHGCALVYNHGNLRALEKPVIGRMVANMAIKTNWFDQGKLATYIQDAQDTKWREEVYNELYGLFNQWNWENKNMSQTAIGLFFATWIQSLLDWRPVVALTGESNSGKTVLMTLINNLFLGLAQFSAQSTAAGVLQNMGINSKPMLLDEFDSGAEQVKLLKHFRVSSRGQDMLKGTSSQDGKTYRVRHIPWIAGIHAGSRHQADINRMIPLRIKSAKNNAHTLDLPSIGELRDLGHKILAGVIVTAQQSISLATQLTKSGGGDIQSRYRESYSIPYGCLGAFMGLNVDAINDIMTDYLQLQVAKEVVLEDAGSDQEALLLDILSSEVRMPKDAPEDTASVAEILFDPEFAAFRNAARNKGVGYVVARDQSGKKVAFAGRRLIGKHGLLRSTDWEQVPGILQVLERLPAEMEPRKEKQNIAGTTATCVCVDYNALRKWVATQKGGE